MTDKELQQLFSLAEKLYVEEQGRTGMLKPIPYAYAKRPYDGAEIFVFPWRKNAEPAHKSLQELFKE